MDEIQPIGSRFIDGNGFVFFLFPTRRNRFLSTAAKRDALTFSSHFLAARCAVVVHIKESEGRARAMLVTRKENGGGGSASVPMEQRATSDARLITASPPVLDSSFFICFYFLFFIFLFFCFGVSFFCLRCFPLLPVCSPPPPTRPPPWRLPRSGATQVSVKRSHAQHSKPSRQSPEVDDDEQKKLK